MFGELLGLAGTLAGGLLSSNAASNSADAAKQAAAIQASHLRHGITAEKKSTKKAEGFLKPYMQTGTGANTLLADALGINGPDAQANYFTNFQNDPGYIAARDAGAQTIEQGSVLGGSLHSGGTLKALQDYGQRLMWTQFQDRLRGLAGMGGQGLTAGTTAGGYETSFGQNKANLLGQIGTAKASGIVGAANANSQNASNMLGLGGYVLGNAVGGGYRGGNDLASYFSTPATQPGSSASNGWFYDQPVG